jgi:cardiolipin synthase
VSIPNIITLGRLLAVPLAVYLILAGELGWAFWTFVAAALSDAVDGFIARAFRARTHLGAYLDPIADKALLVSVYVALGHEGSLPVWLVILVVFRDLLIVGGVLLIQTLKESLAMQPSWASKLNTVMQLLLIAFVLAPHGFVQLGAAFDVTEAVRVLTLLTAATTAWSGIGYLIQGSRVMSRQGGTR